MLGILGATTATLLALSSVGLFLFGSPPPSATSDVNLAKVCQVIWGLSTLDPSLTNKLTRHTHSQTPADSPLAWPPLPHEILGLDITKPPFSQQPPSNEIDAASWSYSLQREVARALGRWPGERLRDNKEIEDALASAASCLRRVKLFLAYRQVIDPLMEHWWWTRRVSQDSDKRQAILTKICCWSEGSLEAEWRKVSMGG